MEFIKKYWYILAGLLIALPLLYKYYMAQIARIGVKATELEVKESANENALSSPKIQTQKADKILTTKVKSIDPKVKERLKNNAEKIAYNLGTSAGIGWSVYGWSENDEEVGRIIKTEANNLKLIADLYFSVYTESRNLKNDLNKYLDNDVKDNYRAFCKSKNITPYI